MTELIEPFKTQVERDGYILLTGCTGLLGRYLLRDLILAGQNVCVLVRSSHRSRATDRVETIMSGWEQRLERRLPRPVILEGELDKPGLGLCKADLRWLRSHCESVIHSAASLKFEPDETGEPERTNLQGTKNLLKVCESAGILDFHHISTAYVAGLRKGKVREDELDVGQEWGNIYEQSKCEAEKVVRRSKNFRSITIYRPSIIVGDSRTGYTTTYHGFYTPLRLGYVIFTKTPVSALGNIDLLGALGLTGEERKNLVPVDWVSAAITALALKWECHGQVYHLTNPRPVTVEDMKLAFLDVLLPLVGHDAKSNDSPGFTAVSQANSAFQDQMEVYRAYWRDDPVFDRTNIDQALPNLPFPEFGLAEMRNLAAFAIDNNFGWPAERIIRADNLLEEWIQALSETSYELSESVEEELHVNLQVTGPGGGDWNFTIDQDGVLSPEQGIRKDAPVTYYMNSTTFRDLLSGRIAAEQGLTEGRILAIGSSDGTRDLAQFLEDIFAAGVPEMSTSTATP